MITIFKREWNFWISDLLALWFWVGGFPYLLQYLVVDVMS